MGAVKRQVEVVVLFAGRAFDFEFAVGVGFTFFGVTVGEL